MFKTSSSTALIQKVAKSCFCAQEVLDLVDEEEKRQSDKQQQQRKQSLATSGNPQDSNDNKITPTAGRQATRSPPVTQVASNLVVHKRNRWIKCALIEKKLVTIVEYLAANASKYYESDALMSNFLSAQILCSLLVGPCALEFSRSKTNDYYQFEEPSADELLKRHKLSNPIACLCSQKRFHANQQGQQQQHIQLSRSATDNNCLPMNTSNRPHRSRRATTSQASLGGGQNVDDMATSGEHNNTNCPASSCNQLVRTESRRRPLALKTNVKSGALVTECHHYSCQEISEHQQTRGYSFKCASSNGLSNMSSDAAKSNPSTSGAYLSSAGSHRLQSSNNSGQQTAGQQECWSVWSPRMLHETLHQNSKSNLLYAKNNVLLETQPHETMAGYLSLHQTSSDLILKWIPNQMINSQANGSSLPTNESDKGFNCYMDDANNLKNKNSTKSRSKSEDIDQTHGISAPSDNSSQPVGSSYLDLIVSLSVSRIVLLHCHFGGAGGGQLEQQVTKNEHDTTSGQNDEEHQEKEQYTDEVTPQAELSNSATEETLILVETDGIQRAPFKFPKGGLRWFLSCLESGLRPDKYLDPAIKPDDSVGPWPDPLQIVGSGSDPNESQSSPLATSSEPASDSRLDSLLRRLPSLKRRQPAKSESGDVKTPSQTNSQATSPTPSEPQQQPNLAPRTPLNYVYRIVSVQQPEWPLQTPPHSALSVASSSSGSFVLASASKVPAKPADEQHETANAQQDQKFRWSLSRLARFSSRYTNSAGSTSSSSMGGCVGTGTGTGTGTRNGSISTVPINSSFSSLSGNLMNQQTLENVSLCGSNDISLVPNGSTDLQTKERIPLMKRDSSEEFVRIEAKLNDLKKSSSDELMALRNQSIQTLCESMRKQILARAFYGWLAYCRRTKIIRTHLKKLIKDECHLIEEFVDPGEFEEAKLGLTRDKWNELMETSNREQLAEAELCRKVNQLVYYGGIESNELRVEVWPFLLELFRFCDSQETKKAKIDAVREAYESCCREWIKVERVVKQRDNEILAANMAKVVERETGKVGEAEGLTETDDFNRKGSRTSSETRDDIGTTKDPNNNDNDDNDDNNIAEERHESQLDEMHDRGQDPLVDDHQLRENCEGCNLVVAGEQMNGEEGDNSSALNAQSSNIKGQQQQQQRMRKTGTRSDAKLAAKRRRRRVRLESTGSVSSDASITDQFGNNIHRIDKDVQRCDRNFWYFKNVKNLDKLRNIMCNYVWQHLDVGYVQGMCDLAAPFLVIFDDEILAYTCFNQLMKRMVANFPHGCAMDQHFESLKYLMQVLDPKLFEILQNNGDYTHFYFCYRWLLLDFKRGECSGECTMKDYPVYPALDK